MSDLVGGLPVGATSSLRQAVLGSIARHRLGYRLFQALGRCYGVQELRVAGDYGLIEGPLGDSAVLQAYARKGGWARTANQFFCDFFAEARGGTYIDIGANLGLTTIPVAQNARVACKAFEPSPDNFLYMTRNIQANCPHKNVELFNLALFDRTGDLAFSVSARNSGDNRVRADGEAARHPDAADRVIRVPADRLDNVFDVTNLPRPVAVKIVTQGAEARILAGGPRLFEHVDAVVFEFDPALILQIDRGIDITLALMRGRFRYAALSDGPRFETGDVAERLLWRPVAAVIDDMQRFMARASPVPGIEYYYVYARR